MVTGAGRGIGKALAVGLAGAGADVAVADLPEALENARRTAGEIEQLGRRGLAMVMDVRELPQIQEGVRQVAQRLGRLDVLVNNAGGSIRRGALEVTEADWDWTLGVNLRGLFFCCQAVARVMIPQGGGRIINIASQLGTVALPDRAPYCAAKGGVINLTRALALEWAPHRINVNAIGPGPTASERLLQAMEAAPGDAAFYTQRLPLGRLVQPEELVGAAVFLASDASRMVTGQTYLVDAGWTIT